MHLKAINAPGCFYIEGLLRHTIKIRVFHDNRLGTSFTPGADLPNPLEIVGKDIAEVKIVFSGAGAAAISTAEHYIRLGVKRDHIILCDRAGVIYKGREGDMDPYKARFMNDTRARTVADALVGAD